MEEYKLIEYIKGALSKAEQEEVLRWIDADPAHRDHFSQVKAKWVFANLPDTIQTSTRLPLLRRGRILNLLCRVAAILLIPVTLWLVYENSFRPDAKSALLSGNLIQDTMYRHQQETLLHYSVNPGVKGKILLPDGSTVWLNSASSLSCPARFAPDSRVVELDGEGYFEVVSNKEWPLYVKTRRNITVKVTGTIFNLTSYSNDDHLRFTLLEGNVTLIKEGSPKEIEVKPKEEIIIPDKEPLDRIRKQEADVVNNTAWKEGYLIFEASKMQEVINRLERWYGVKITVVDDQLLKYSFTGNFHSESILQVLELMKITSNIPFSIKDKEIILGQGQ